MPVTNRVRAEHSRTFTGCRTCRRRHAKCDEERPECGACSRLGLKCGGYSAQLSWVTDEYDADSNDQPALCYRYPLFSDLERRIMSDSLSESLGLQSAGEVLLKLDLACKKVEAGFDLCLGPFSAFQAVDNSIKSISAESPTSASLLGVSPDAEGPQSEESDEPVIEFEEIRNGQSHQADLEAFLDNTTFSLIEEHHMTIPDAFTSPVSDLFNDIPLDPAILSISDDISALETTDSNGYIAKEDARVLCDDLDASMMISPSIDPVNNQTNLNLPEQAANLLRYYQQHISSSTSSIQINRQSPWQLIFLPCVFETFAEITLMSSTSHTRNTILHAVLAHSAFRLHKPNNPSKPTEYWGHVGLRHRNKAQFHLKKAVETEMANHEQKTYKELLMAFLAMAMTSLYRGCPTAKVFLVDAERLIRVRGLGNHSNPYKIRVLHHMYTYLRILVESIATLTLSSSDPETNVLQALPNARSFRVSKETLNIGLDPTVEKTAEIGYGDIHLEVQGLWKQTLHYNLQGIPESLMTLIAQTTSLANEKAHLETRAGCDLRLSADLKHHIKTLEESIWVWSLPSELTTISTHKPAAVLPDDQDLIHSPCIQSMVQAIHRALVIYFYRRIHDVSAMVLQDHVRQALENLELCIEEMVEDDDFAPSLAWAAYISACEATTPELQKRALKCVSISDRRGVHFTSKPSTEVVLSIWGERCHETTLSYKWTSMLQEIHV
ncbi:unnamed protein product [Clonostachys solani]|uniref:Zn(2)-C6 fungal-type domain-containing protein n=1 Tax=Clonostachys solani TaxID=160281 RepID=A0A9N9ZE58_9HYPO|nr:unnamed protein product [Clonostachys solani]